MPEKIEFETQSAAERYAEKHGTVTKLRGGAWRAWVKMPDGNQIKEYGHEKAHAVANAATALLQKYPYRYE